MSSNNFFPSLTSIQLQTDPGSPELVLYTDGRVNILHISCSIGGLLQRTIPLIHETLDYVAVYFTLYHQFGGRETTIVRRYLFEFDPQKIDMKSNTDHAELEIPIDDDFSGINFVDNYYYLQVSFTHKQPDEMGVSESIQTNKIFETKIPFMIEEVL
ncbi:hypothetical protein BAQ49_07650 [Bacillus proteolyticus]|uniref:Uncharacterized protein n=1 Tax=Bacillus proteolyticus TaxID=2026192 RepID=A0AA44R7D4_9BACI|nr:hypothetical protein [Bacillus proteolyticus]OJE45022.1 hypothetical protein BAQ49_07650 [Bacillus proteolyticus]